MSINPPIYNPDSEKSICKYVDDLHEYLHKNEKIVDVNTIMTNMIDVIKKKNMKLNYDYKKNRKYFRKYMIEFLNEKYISDNENISPSANIFSQYYEDASFGDIRHCNLIVTRLFDYCYVKNNISIDSNIYTELALLILECMPMAYNKYHMPEIIIKLDKIANNNAENFNIFMEKIIKIMDTANDLLKIQYNYSCLLEDQEINTHYGKGGHIGINIINNYYDFLLRCISGMASFLDKFAPISTINCDDSQINIDILAKISCITQNKKIMEKLFEHKLVVPNNELFKFLFYNSGCYTEIMNYWSPAKITICNRNSGSLHEMIDLFISYGYIINYDDILLATKHCAKINDINISEFSFDDRYDIIVKHSNFNPYNIRIKYTYNDMLFFCKSSYYLEYLDQCIIDGLKPDQECMKTAVNYSRQTTRRTSTSNKSTIKFLIKAGVNLDDECKEIIRDRFGDTYLADLLSGKSRNTGYKSRKIYTTDNNIKYTTCEKREPYYYDSDDDSDN